MFTGPGVAGSAVRILAGRNFLILACVLGVTACGPLLTATTSDVAGVAGAGVASAVTSNAAAATGIGLGIAAGATAGLQYVERTVHGDGQDQIAAVAGALEPGVVGHWSVTYKLPIEEDQSGSLVVTRLIGSKDFQCREVVFSVDEPAASDTAKDAPAAADAPKDASDDAKPIPVAARPEPASRSFFITVICKDGPVWKWASAEPATARWGALQ